MKRWLAGMLTILLLGVAGAHAAEKKPPADTKPAKSAGGEARKTPPTQQNPPAPKNPDKEANKESAPNEGATGKSPAPDTPANAPAEKAKPNGKAAVTASNKSGATSTGKAPPGETATTRPSAEPALVDRKDQALLRDLEMLLLLEILNNYEMFEGVGE